MIKKKHKCQMNKLTHTFKGGRDTVLFKNIHWLWNKTELLPEDMRLLR